MNGGRVQIGADWPVGICHYCGVADAQVDGDKVCWLDSTRRICNRPPCIQRFHADLERVAGAVARATRRRNSAEIHELIREQAKQKRRQYRAAAKARKRRVA